MFSAVYPSDCWWYPYHGVIYQPVSWQPLEFQGAWSALFWSHAMASSFFPSLDSKEALQNWDLSTSSSNSPSLGMPCQQESTHQTLICGHFISNFVSRKALTTTYPRAWGMPLLVMNPVSIRMDSPPENGPHSLCGT